MTHYQESAAMAAPFLALNRITRKFSLSCPPPNIPPRAVLKGSSTDAPLICTRKARLLAQGRGNHFLFTVECNQGG